MEPTVIEVTPEMDIARDMEVFGPVWPVIPFDTLEEALEIANNTIFGLSSGVITSDMKTAMKVANGIQAGACIINGTGNYRLALWRVQVFRCGPRRRCVHSGRDDPAEDDLL